MNKKHYRDHRAPPDDIGNRCDNRPWQSIPHDQIGNSVDSEPTHLWSGILVDLWGKGHRRRQEQESGSRSSRLVEGGVNPAVALGQQPPQQRNQNQNRPRFEQKPRRERQESADLFQIEENETEFVLKSAPEDKRKKAEEVVSAILQKAGRQAQILAKLEDENGKPKVVVEIDDQGVDLPLFNKGQVALSALNFIVNKIVNRYPDDRIRLMVQPKEEAQV